MLWLEVKPGVAHSRPIGSWNTGITIELYARVKWSGADCKLNALTAGYAEMHYFSDSIRQVINSKHSQKSTKVDRKQ